MHSLGIELIRHIRSMIILYDLTIGFCWYKIYLNTHIQNIIIVVSTGNNSLSPVLSDVVIKYAIPIHHFPGWVKYVIGTISFASTSMKLFFKKKFDSFVNTLSFPVRLLLLLAEPRESGTELKVKILVRFVSKYLTIPSDLLKCNALLYVFQRHRELTR